MAISLSVVSAFVLVALVTFTPADSATCKILKNGALTMFSGDKHTVALPCRYQLADFTCGDYTIKVEAESSLDGTDQYSPESVSITLTQQTGNNQWIGSHNTGLLEQQQAWAVQVNDISLDQANYDPVTKSAVLKKNGIFEITFSYGQSGDGVKITCSASTKDFTAGTYPTSMCGDPTKTGAVSARKTDIFGSASDEPRTILYDILNDNSITQSGQCQTIAADFQASTPNQKKDVARYCGPIFTAPPLPASQPSAVTNFESCMSTYINNNVAKSKALIEALMENQIQIDV